MLFSVISVCLSLVSLINGYPSTNNDDQCSNYCANGALCLIEENAPRCYCFPEWQGERCHLPRKSSSNRSFNGKELSRIQTRNTPCSYFPDLCRNGGVCYLDKDTLACQCPYPFDGLRCETYSVCYNYCFNGGVCTEKNGADPEKKEPKCECDAEYEGSRCQYRLTTTPGTTTTTTTTTDSTTTDVICSYLPKGFCNLGSCIVVNNRAVCQCPSTHTGDQCQFPTGLTQGPIVATSSPFLPIATNPPIIPGQTNPPINPMTSTLPPINGITCAQNPCRNGRPCYNTGNTYYCYCGPSYTGTNCEFFQG